MVKKYWIIFCLIGLGSLPAGAEIYRYTDDQGVMHFTNDLSTVPESRMGDIVEEKEVVQELNPLKAVESGKSGLTAPSNNRASTQEKYRHTEIGGKNELKSAKSALETEYEYLKKEKAAIDDDIGFQKRKDKKKYKHRPYIEERVKREEEINKRMREIESEIKKINLQL